MLEILWVIFSALWLGVLTSISPCPLATNIAAISFISKKLSNKKQTLLSGLFYTIGRSFVYVVLTLVVVISVVSVPELSMFLQNYMNKILGIVLVLTGMFLLELITIDIKNNWINTLANKISAKFGIVSSFLIGLLFALAFCPVSAALFFGGFIPLSIKTSYGWLTALIYGLGTALPVVLFSFLIAFGVKSLNKFFNKIAAIEFWARRVTGIVFILVGVYYIFMYIFKVI